ncbi:MAG: sugar phosphate nucleotidyltransferase [Acidobacteriota bacterium]
MQRWAVILAGGMGTRFWPWSRQNNPKQFLPVISKSPMIEETVKRIKPMIPEKNIIIVTHESFYKKIKKIFPKFNKENILLEPESKNTAPAVIYVASFISKKDRNSSILILPADHFIRKDELFHGLIKSAFEIAEENDYLITFGINPKAPETGYGYIEINRNKQIQKNGNYFFEVKQFKEKPSKEKAIEFISSKNFFWNSGIFLWSIEAFENKLEKFAPEFFVYYKKFENALAKKDFSLLKNIYKKIQSISIDYALMEKSDDVFVGKANFIWSDVGSWSSLYELWGKDKNNNAIRANLTTIDSSGCVVFSEKKLISLIDVKDMVIIDTDDALLICPKEKSQRVKEIIEMLKKEKKLNYL